MSFRNIFPADKPPVVVFDVTVDLTNDSLYELWRIGLFQGLMQMHDVAHHLCMKSTWVTHAVLKGQMVIMELGVVLYCLGGHVVHALVSVELPLGN